MLREADVVELLEDVLPSWGLDGRSVACVIPDGTRTAPMPFLHRALEGLLSDSVSSLEWLIALGTHQPMQPRAIARHLGLDENDAAALARVRNHDWHDPGTLVSVGTITADEVEEISEGRLVEPVRVRVNRHLLEHDVAVVVGPVFPHEVVGFSGGNKYFFPGLSGQELIDVSHWLGALHTSSAVIRALGRTPIRRLIDRAAALLPIERRCIALVVRPADAKLHGVYLGGCEDAWAAAAALSSRVHVRRVEAPFDSVLAVSPPMYADLWTAAKGIYKLEPVVVDGGELILYAPHVTSFSTTHGRVISRVGYHCRDYFLAQRERFVGVPLGVLAHSTHVRGSGRTWTASSAAASTSPSRPGSRETNASAPVSAGAIRHRSTPRPGRGTGGVSSLNAPERCCTASRQAEHAPRRFDSSSCGAYRPASILAVP